jgi:hypothetical protein
MEVKVMEKARIEIIKVQHILDSDPDTSFIGEYTDKADEWNICRHCGEYLFDAEAGNRKVEDLENEVHELQDALNEFSSGEKGNGYIKTKNKILELEKEIKSIELHDCYSYSREYDYFRPYSGGEEEGTEEYIKYGKQDFKRMEEYTRGEWCFIGINAYAEVSYSIGNGNRRLETFTSSGLWGIESDSGEYLEEVAEEELTDLKSHLEQFNVNISDFDEKAKEAKQKPDFTQ